jgi:hypothetical protein
MVDSSPRRRDVSLAPESPARWSEARRRSCCPLQGPAFPWSSAFSAWGVIRAVRLRLLTQASRILGHHPELHHRSPRRPAPPCSGPFRHDRADTLLAALPAERPKAGKPPRNCGAGGGPLHARSEIQPGKISPAVKISSAPSPSGWSLGRSIHVRIDSVIHVCHDTGGQEIKETREMRKLIAVGILVGAM